jgi:hypothetical protein
MLQSDGISKPPLCEGAALDGCTLAEPPGRLTGFQGSNGAVRTTPIVRRESGGR